MVNSLAISPSLLERIRKDLAREIPPELDADERVGFVFAKLDEFGSLNVTDYSPLGDHHYIERPPFVGVCYSGDVIFEAQLRVMKSSEVFFTIHCHFGFGEPVPSRTDLRSEAELVQCFLQVKLLPHGSIILSEDTVLVRCWSAEKGKMLKIKNVFNEDKEVL